MFCERIIIIRITLFYFFQKLKDMNLNQYSSSLTDQTESIIHEIVSKLMFNYSMQSLNLVWQRVWLAVIIFLSGNISILNITATHTNNVKRQEHYYLKTHI